MSDQLSVDVDVDVAVVGAGIIGVACALQLARQGLRVQVFDPDGVGQGASFGNAGHLAIEQVDPLASAANLRSLPPIKVGGKC